MSQEQDFDRLLARARDGDRDAMDELMALLRPRIEEIARKYSDPGRPAESSSDIAQEAWLRAWQKLHQFRGGDESEETRAMLLGWVGQIVHSVGLNAVRHRQAQKRSPADGNVVPLNENPNDSMAGSREAALAADTPTPSSVVRTDELAGLIRAALDRIPDDTDRTIVRLRSIEGLPLREIAERVELTYDQVRERYRRCMRQLERELGDLQ